MFISKDPVLPHLELKSLLLYDKFPQQNKSYFNTQKNNSNHLLDRSDSSKCVTTGCNDKGYEIEDGDGDGDDGKGVIETKPLITSIDDTQCPEKYSI